ncbi:endonuclease/exonuclease/phosphatase family protein, partial [Trifolium pratense]
MEELCCMLGYDSCFSVDCEGRGGGLALMWFSSFQCSVTNFSSNHIDIEVMDSGSGNWRLTGFYGFPGSGRRRDSWNFLRHLSRLSPQPWCIFGTREKGRDERAPWLINGFRSAVMDSGLVDVHMEGYPITWFKSLGTNRAVEERRALANEAWSQLFPNVILENLAAPASDHYPILLVRQPESRGRGFQSRFKFENAWLVDPEFRDYVRDRWSSYGDQAISQKLNMCALDLTFWNKNHFQRLRHDIDKCRRKIDRLRCQKQNSVLGPVISTIDHSISSDDNIMLTAQFTLEEFKEAMFSMNPDKCP